MNVLNVFSDLGEKVMMKLGRLQGYHEDDVIPSKSRVEHIFDKQPLSSILPYQAYDAETGTFISDNSCGFVIETLPIIGADDTIQNEIVSIFQEMMEEGSSIQCLLWADHRVSQFLNNWALHRKDSKEIFQWISRKRIDYLMNSRNIGPRIYRFILSYSVPVQSEQAFQTSLLESLAEKRQRIQKALQSVTYAFSWDAQDFIQTLDGIINFQTDPLLQPRTWDQIHSLSEQIPRDGVLRVEEDHLVRSSGDGSKTIFKSYRAIDFPDRWSLGAMQALIGDLLKDSFRISYPFLLHYGIHCPKQEKADRQFHRRMQLVENQGRSSMLLRFIPELADELQELDFVRKSVSQDMRFVWTQLGAGLWAEDREIAQAEQALKSLFRINQFTIVSNNCIHLPHFLSFLPMAWSEYVDALNDMNLLKTTLTNECGNLVPIQGEWMGTPSPGMLFVGRRGQLCNWNPFDNREGNYNIVVAGRSGSGKSVFMQDLLISSLGTGAKVFVLEVGRSFEKLCHAVDGQYIEFSRNNPLCLNPFTYIAKDDLEQRNHSFSMLKSIIALMASSVELTSSYENGLIEKAIAHAWEEQENEATISDIADWLASQEDEKAKQLGIMLTPFVKGGIYSRYFEGRNNVDFTEPFVLIELEELKEKKDLQAVVLQMFIMTITNQIYLGDRKTAFHICIDEAWDLLRGNQTGHFIEGLARRLRKYNGSLVVGTQSIDDFYSNPGALAAYENSDWTCLLSQKKSSIRRFVDSGKVDLSEQGKVMLESVKTRQGEFSEIMISDAHGQYSIVRLLLDPFSNILYSSRAEDYTKVKEYQSQGLSVIEAIEKVLAEM